MAAETFDFTDSAGTTLAGYRWEPSSTPRAAVQIIHGMGEHILRYGHVADALNEAGFVVYGYDQRGHGASIGDGVPGEVGEAGWPHLVDDIAEFARLIRAREPGLPVGMFAHSMGSFAAQQMLLHHSSVFDAVALSGTAAIDLLEPALDLNASLDLAVFNAGFQPQRTDFDWLSRDDAAVDAYLADPLCGFGLDSGAGRAMFLGARALADTETSEMRRDLSMYLAVGDQDPVNAGLALFTPLVERLRGAGFADVTTKIYPGARHEIVNETNRDEVIGDLVGWLTDKLIPS